MPITYRYDGNILIVEMVGEYAMAELRDVFLQSLSDPQCPARPRLLINLEGSKSIHNRSSEDVRAMASFVGSLSQRVGRRIALVAADDLVYGLMRMGSVGSEERGIESEVFRTFDEARQWLLS